MSVYNRGDTFHVTLIVYPDHATHEMRIDYHTGKPLWEWLRGKSWRTSRNHSKFNRNYTIDVIGLFQFKPSDTEIKAIVDDLLTPLSPNWRGLSLRIAWDNYLNGTNQVATYDPRHETGLFPPEFTIHERCLYR